MVQPVDPDTLGFLVTDIARLFRAEIDRRVAQAGLGLTAGEGRALSQAARAGCVRQNVLAERMGVEAMTLSTYVDKLEDRGLIERRTDPSDRRAKLLQLTPAADETLAAIAPIGAAIRAQASQGIAPQDWERLHEMLKLVRDNLSSIKADGAQQDRPAS